MIRPVRLLHKGRRGQRTADRGEGWAGQEKDCILWQKGDFKKGYNSNIQICGRINLISIVVVDCKVEWRDRIDTPCIVSSHYSSKTKIIASFVIIRTYLLMNGVIQHIIQTRGIILRAELDYTMP